MYIFALIERLLARRFLSESTREKLDMTGRPPGVTSFGKVTGSYSCIRCSARSGSEPEVIVAPVLPTSRFIQISEYARYLGRFPPGERSRTA
jgi:hypothetical protein